MISVVVRIGDSPGYIRVEEHNLIITPDIAEASKFEQFGDAISCILSKAREVFKNDKFVTGSCDNVIFGSKPRNIIKEETILNDTYFSANIY